MGFCGHGVIRDGYDRLFDRTFRVSGGSFPSCSQHENQKGVFIGPLRRSMGRDGGVGDGFGVSWVPPIYLSFPSP